MRAEEVYNIAIHLPEKELNRLYAFIGKKLVAKQRVICKTIKRKLITEEEARRHVLRVVFGIDT